MKCMATYVGAVLLISTAGYLWLFIWAVNYHGPAHIHVNHMTKSPLPTKYPRLVNSVNRTFIHSPVPLTGLPVNVSSLAIASPEQEIKVFNECEQYLSNKTENKSAKYVISQSPANYQCDILALCHREDSRLEDENTDNTSIRICPCFPPELGKS